MAEYSVFELDKQRKKISEEEKRTRQEEIDDVKKILKTPEGKRYLWRLMSECGIFRSSFTLNSNQSAFNEGVQNVGLGVLKDINDADPYAFARMQSDYIEKIKTKKEAQDVRRK